MSLGAEGTRRSSTLAWLRDGPLCVLLGSTTWHASTPFLCSVVIVLNLLVTQTDAQRIGNPQQWDKAHGGGGAAPPFAAAQQQPLGAGPPAYNAMGGYGGPPAVNQPGGYGVAPPNQGALRWGLCAVCRLWGRHSWRIP